MGEREGGEGMRRLIAMTVLLALCAGIGMMGFALGKREYIVGRDIGFDDIAEFYYTVSASTDPPFYQRYHIYMEDGGAFLYHETREGGGWPQTEADITAAGTVALTDAQAEAFRDCLSGGTVRRRSEDLGDGDDGPWLYLYWNGDGGDIQEFDFASWEQRKDFEALCAAIREGAGE